MIRSKSTAAEDIGRRRRSANQANQANQTNNNINNNNNNNNNSNSNNHSNNSNRSSETWVPGPDVKIIRLNIGGAKFSTTLGTLCKFPDSMLAVMFSGRFGPPALDDEGYYFIDRREHKDAEGEKKQFLT